MKNAFFGGLRRRKLWQFWLLAVLGWNVDFGPDQDNERANAKREGLCVMYKDKLPHEVPLFQSVAPRLIKDLEDAGHEFARKKPIEIGRGCLFADLETHNMLRCDINHGGMLSGWRLLCML